MDKNSRELFQEILKTESLGKELQAKIRSHLKNDGFECQCVSKEDLHIIVGLDFKKVTDEQMQEIADIMMSADLSDSGYWEEVESAAEEVLGIKNGEIPPYLKV